MGASTTVLNIVGVIFLSHAVYSAHEQSLLPNTSSSSISLDIVLETVISVLLLCVGVVLSSPQLKPIQWSKWAGRLERDSSAREIREAGQVAGNPYKGLEERMAFLDVRGARKSFQGWMSDTKR